MAYYSLERRSRRKTVPAGRQVVYRARPRRRRRPKRWLPVISGVLLALVLGWHTMLVLGKEPATQPEPVRADGMRMMGQVEAPSIQAREEETDAVGGDVLLQVAPLLQRPELPNGCEGTALAMVLCYYGFAAEKGDIACNYIPRQEITGQAGARKGPNPAEAYAGDPASRAGFYCFAPPVVEGARRYLAVQGSALGAEDISGTGTTEWEAQLDAGRPVILWVTLDYSDQVKYLPSWEWALPDGSQYTPFANLHCVVLQGYDTGNFYVCDPLAGKVVLEKATLYNSYLALGAHAAVVG